MTVTNVQILDTIAIDLDTYILITKYINETAEFGDTNTLISYPALIWADNKNYKREKQKRFTTDFNLENFRRLLQKFHIEIINKKYKCNILKENLLKPNDTRHLAFISLMMQGFSPIEIARLGGHQTINAQYHYSHHVEHWIDNEVFKLMTKFKHITNDGNTANIIPKELQLKAYSPPTSDYYGKLELGYCTDSIQRCETAECMLCSHWRIDPKDLLLKHDHIKAKLANKKDKIQELFAFIRNLHINILKDDLKINPHTIMDLKVKANNIQAEINNLYKIQSLNFRGEMNNNE